MNDLTPGQRAWHVFKKNRAAMAGLLLIALAFFTAVFAYMLMPDDAPNANSMSLPLSLKKPGASFKVLLIPDKDKQERSGAVSGFFPGKPLVYRQIPITSYQIKADSVIVDEYVSSEDKPERRAFALNIFDNPALISNKNNFANKYIETKTFWLGSDIYGRDLLSRVILGTRISLAVGIMAVLISLVVGVTIGAVAGYYGGKTDAALSWVMNILWSLPALLLVIALSFALGKGLWQIFIAVGLSMWVEAARLVRGQVISLKQAEYIEAARALGYTNSRIITRHILPNMAGPVMVIAASNFASAILLEAGLSFLGFGAQPPVPTWGGMIREHYGYIIMDAAYLAIIPGLAIMIMVYAFNLVTTGLRDAFDIKSQNVRL
ncbi:ABC transporter permease [uncultured Mucilaginibacter sp.]|uniref:ABC transporter permease n=1 Tax=uncultured Mucilaginibacter sp. TaxID=797541 RepID=UPI0025DE1862|nr:ABC transporter permease [uncultured Mucilaginibacter sp.]